MWRPAGRWGVWRGVVLVALAAAMGVPLIAFGARPSRAATDTGALPPQPGIAAPACKPEATKPNTWDTVGSQTPVQGASQGATWVPYRVVMDSWRPCLGYRLAGDGRALERSSDTGATWQRVFFDDRLSVTGSPFHITSVVVPSEGAVLASED